MARGRANLHSGRGEPRQECDGVVGHDGIRCGIILGVDPARLGNIATRRTERLSNANSSHHQCGVGNERGKI